MKNRFYYALVGAILTGAFSSCSNEKEEITENGDKILKFHVEGVNTRTPNDELNDNYIKEGNYVGIYGVTTGGYIVNGTNNKYSAQSEGNLKAESGDISISNNVSNVDFYAYAPYNSEWTEYDKEYDFTVATDQSEDSGYLASDLLFAQTKYDGNTNEIGLTFDHKLAKINLVIQKEQDSLTDASVCLNNTKIQTKFNPSTGAIGEATGTGSDITMLSSMEAGTEIKAYCIIVPQTFESNKNLFTIHGNNSYSVSLQNDLEIKEGNSYTFTITINEEDAVLKVGKPNINPWKDGDDDNGVDEGDNNGVEEKKYLYPTWFVYTKNSIGDPTYVYWDWDVRRLVWQRRENNASLQVLPYDDQSSEQVSVEDCLKFKSLVFEIEKFKKEYEDINSYLVVGNDQNNTFKTSNGVELQINGTGNFAVDLTNSENKDILKSSIKILIFCKAEGNNSEQTEVIFSDVYLTTKKASEIDTEN